MTNKKKLEVVFAPGCFDNFDGTQEELDEMMEEIHRMIESGELFEKSKAIDLEDLDDEIQIKLMASLESLDNDEPPGNRTLH